MTHVVDAIAERFRQLLVDQTDAHDRVTRDRSIPPTAMTDLPTIDIKIGASKKAGAQSFGIVRATVTLLLDLSISDNEADASSTLLTLNAQVHAAIMRATVWTQNCIRVEPAEDVFEEVRRETQGAIQIASQRLAFDALYQHSLTDTEA